jgi:uncharacterized phage protein gp47/JayE
MPTANDLTTQMTQAAAVSLPTLDTSIGSPVRSLFDLVSEVVSEQTADQYLLQYGYNVNAMTGSNLDAFVNTFGTSRFAAKRAVGYITLSRATPATQDLVFAVGAQVTTQDTPPIVFTVIIPTTLPQGGTSVTVPVQASIAGSSGNVAASTVTQPLSPFNGISNITNSNAFTGGADAESDDQLRARFLATVFRQLTGTSDMYLATALENPYVTQANVIGSVEIQNEQVQISNPGGTSGGIAFSAVENFTYLYPGTVSLIGVVSVTDPITGNVTQEQNVFTPGSQYTLTSEAIPASSITPATTITTSGGHYGISITNQYAVTIVTIAGESNLSAYGSATTATGSVNEFVTTWSAPGTSFDSDIVGFNVYKFNTATQQFQKVGSTNATTHTFTDSNTLAFGVEAPTYNTTGTPILRILDFLNITNGIYQLQYNYLSTSSRNDPPNQINNRIDIYVNGQNPTEAFQNFVWSNALVFNNTGSTTIENAPTSMNVNLFQRIDGTTPVVGNYFTPFSFAPIIDMLDNSFGPPLTPYNLNGTQWVEGTNYWVVNDVSQFGLGSTSRSGIEWATPGPAVWTDTVHVSALATALPLTRSLVTTSSVVVTNLAGNTTYTLNTDYTLSTTGSATTITIPASGSAISNGNTILVTYGYRSLPLTAHFEFNQVPAAVQTAVESWRLVTTDVVVHQAQVLNLNMYLSVVTLPGYLVNAILSQIQASIANYVSSISFSGLVQVSQILSLAQQVPGVLAVRFLTSEDFVRTDTGVGITNTLSLVTDSAVGVGDAGSPILTASSGIPTGTYIGEVIPGVSFTMVNAIGAAVAATATNNNITLSVGGTDGLFVGDGFFNGQMTSGLYAIQSVNTNIQSLAAFNALANPDEYILKTFATTFGSPFRAIDVQLADNELAVLNNLYLVQQAPNSFGAV